MRECSSEKLGSLNFKQVGIDWIGKIGSYFFTVKDIQSSENELEISFDIAQNLNKGKLFTFLDELESQQKISNYNVVKNSISIVYIEGDIEGLDGFLKNICDQLSSIEAHNVCQNCEGREGLAFYTDWKKHLLLCDECAADVIKKFKADKEENKNYFKGFIFSLAGALIGSVVWILIGALGFFASVAGLAISYCAFRGYEMAKGKYTRFGIALNVISIVIGFLFAQYIVIFIGLAKEWTDFSLMTYLQLTPVFFTDKEFLKALIPDLGFGLLFAVLGSYRTIINNYKSAKENDSFKIEKVEF